MPIQKYKIIYTDPPWRYHSPDKVSYFRGPELHYPTMSTADICALPVKDIADSSSILFLWATFPKLPDAFEVIREWGFTYKTVAFVWVKQNKIADSYFMGLGNWTRANAEICLLATKGKPKRQAKNVHELIVSHIQRHSQKLAETRDRIVSLLGDVPRIELFAHQTAEGWDCWGNEVKCDVELKGYQKA